MLWHDGDDAGAIKRAIKAREYGVSEERDGRNVLVRSAETLSAKPWREEWSTEFDAALFLHERSEEHKRRDEKTVAATVRHREYRARYLRAQFQGPPHERTLRTQKETAGPRNSQTSSEEPSRRWVSSWCHSPGTLRPRVRGVKRFLSWLALRYELTYPTALNQLTEYLQVRPQEPCSRGSLGGPHNSMVFLESMAGVSPQERFTDSHLYNVLYQELLVAALPGNPAKQAPRVLTAFLVAQTPRYYRAFAWWLLIQNWARSGSRITGASCQTV